jgi:hypothetical protein
MQPDSVTYRGIQTELYRKEMHKYCPYLGMLGLLSKNALCRLVPLHGLAVWTLQSCRLACAQHVSQGEYMGGGGGYARNLIAGANKETVECS